MRGGGGKQRSGVLWMMDSDSFCELKEKKKARKACCEVTIDDTSKIVDGGL